MPTNIYTYLNRDSSNNLPLAIKAALSENLSEELLTSLLNVKTRLAEWETLHQSGSKPNRELYFEYNKIRGELMHLFPPPCENNPGWSDSDFEEVLSATEEGDYLRALNHAISVNDKPEFQTTFFQLKCQIVDQPYVDPIPEIAHNGISTVHNRIAWGIPKLLEDIQGQLDFDKRGITNFTIPQKYATLLKALSPDDLEKIATKQGNLTAYFQIVGKNDVRVASHLLNFQKEYVHYQMLRHGPGTPRDNPELEERYKQYLLYLVISQPNKHKAADRAEFMRLIAVPASCLQKMNRHSVQEIAVIAMAKGNRQAFEILIKNQGLDQAVPLLQQEKLYELYLETVDPQHGGFDLDSLQLLSAFEQFLMAKACFPEAF